MIIFMTLSRRQAKNESKAKVRRGLISVICFVLVSICFFFFVSMLIIDKNLFLKGHRRRLQGTSEIRGLERCRSTATDLNSS